MLNLAFRYLARNPAQAFRALVTEPGETWSRFYDEYVYAKERRQAPTPYVAVPDWEKRLHDALGLIWPCEISEECAKVWPAIVSILRAKNVTIGPQTYMHWNDADTALIRAIWCLVRHRRPIKVVETGVGHDVTSRFILEALNENGAGRLWSIHLPPVKT